MFNKNIEALKLKNPQLALRLEKMPLAEAQTNIGVYEAESKDLIITYNDSPLDSIYDPVREAKTIWNRTVKEPLNKNDILIVFGFGLGYLFKRSYINSNSRIIVFEPIADILRFVLEHVDFSNEIADERVFFTCDAAECLEFINQKYLSEDKIEVLYSQYYVSMANNELMSLSVELVNVCKKRGLDSNTVLNRCKNWAKYSVVNIMNYPKSRNFQSLENKFEGKTALIAAAGPSLLNDIKTIKKNRNKFLLIAVNKALNILLENDIKPDFTVFNDSINVKPYVEGIKDEIKDLNLILESRANEHAYSLEAKSKFVYFTENHCFNEFLQEISDGKLKTYESAGTVSLVCYYIAKALGCTKFIYSGLDLAFPKGETYAGIDSSGMSNNSVVQVKGFDGEMVDTRSDYALFIRQFEDMLLKEGGVEIINTALGAYIEGMKYMKLRDALKDEDSADLKVENLKTEKIIKQAYKNSAAEWKQLSDGLYEFIVSQKEVLNNLNHSVKPIVEQLAELIKITEDTKSVKGIENEIQANMVNSLNIISEAASSVILSYYLQGELLKYTRLNGTGTLTFADLNAFLTNKKTELEILEQVEYASLYLAKHINRLVENYPAKVKTSHGKSSPGKTLAKV